MMTIQFPKSRISHSGQCELCTGRHGQMQSSKIFLQDEGGHKIEFLKWTCNVCGHTLLFDMNVVRNRDWENSDFTEILPE